MIAFQIKRRPKFGLVRGKRRFRRFGVIRLEKTDRTTPLPGFRRSVRVRLRGRYGKPFVRTGNAGKPVTRTFAAGGGEIFVAEILESVLRARRRPRRAATARRNPLPTILDRRIRAYLAPNRISKPQCLPTVNAFAFQSPVDSPDPPNVTTTTTRSPGMRGRTTTWVCFDRCV